MTHQEIPHHNIQLFPEFLRISAAEDLFGIKKGKLYELMKTGKITYSEIRDRGALRGVRLISTDSLRSFIIQNMVNSIDDHEDSNNLETSNNK